MPSLPIMPNPIPGSTSTLNGAIAAYDSPRPGQPRRNRLLHAPPR